MNRVRGGKFRFFFVADTAIVSRKVMIGMRADGEKDFTLCFAHRIPRQNDGRHAHT